MPKSLEEIKAFLEKADGGAEYFDSVTQLLESEKQKGIAAKTEANKEARSLRDRLKQTEESVKLFKGHLSKVGFDPEDESADAEEFFTGLAQTLEKAKSGKDITPDMLKSHPDFVNLQKEFKKTQKNFETLSTQYQEANKKAQELQERQRMSILRNSLSKALRDQKGQEMFYGTDLLIDSLITGGRVGLKADETIVFLKGEDEMELSEGVKALAQERKDLLRSNQSGGNGTPPDSGNGSGARTDTDRIKQLRGMGSFAI